ncbi:unnamed protein product [Effrenium voratum]|nr:unnamed protein product [Effrenium voratum]
MANLEGLNDFQLFKACGPLYPVFALESLASVLMGVFFCYLALRIAVRTEVNAPAWAMYRWFFDTINPSFQFWWKEVKNWPKMCNRPLADRVNLCQMLNLAMVIAQAAAFFMTAFRWLHIQNVNGLRYLAYAFTCAVMQAELVILIAPYDVKPICYEIEPVLAQFLFASIQVWTTWPAFPAWWLVSAEGLGLLSDAKSNAVGFGILNICSKGAFTYFMLKIYADYQTRFPKPDVGQKPPEPPRIVKALQEFDSDDGKALITQKAKRAVAKDVAEGSAWKVAALLGRTRFLFLPEGIWHNVGSMAGLTTAITHEPVLKQQSSNSTAKPGKQALHEGVPDETAVTALDMMNP